MALMRSWTLVAQELDEHIVLSMHVSVIVYAIAAWSRIGDQHVLLEWRGCALLSWFLDGVSCRDGTLSCLSLYVAFHLL